ncbi:hypothetical protein MY3296_008266 [Beauveria thailandica]
MQFRPSSCIAAMALVVQTVLAVPSIVTLPYAKYNGLVLSNGVTQWLGMRYAAPPIGDRRFRPPEEPLSETGIQEAKVHGDRCLVTGRPARDPGHSEDCLFINVQAPTHAKGNSRLPVFVYLRGDGYNNTLTDANINTTGLMVQNDNDFIVVTLNHRLGPYGFLTRGDGMASNNGIRDQIKALDWVTRFIRRFGGNPEQIVLGGSGIGAQNVLIHLTMQKEYNPHFKGIIAESPSFPPLLDLEQAEKQYLEFAKQMGCSSNTKPKCPSSEYADCGEEKISNCLLALSADDIQEAGHNNTLSTLEAPPWDRWLPVVDYDLIIDTTTNNFKHGHFAQVPFIIGNVVDTGTAFAHRDGRSTDDVIDYMSDLYPRLLPEDLEEINTMYPNANDSCDTPSCAYGQISNVVQDSRYVCPALIATQGMKKKGIEGSYLYLWDVDDKSDGPLDPDTRQNMEAAMLWGPVVVDVPDSFKQGGGNDAVPYVKQRYWTNFIRSLNPNRQHKFQDYKYSMTAADKKIRLALWPQWWTGGRKRLVFGNGGKNRKRDTGYIKWTCTFWDRLSPWSLTEGNWISQSSLPTAPSGTPAVRPSGGCARELASGNDVAAEAPGLLPAAPRKKKQTASASCRDVFMTVGRVVVVYLKLRFEACWYGVRNHLTRDKVDEFLPVRCPDAAIMKRMEDMIAELRDQHDSIGGTVTCIIRGCPSGLGEPCFDKLEALLAHAIMSIPATKGFEIGSGFHGAEMRGSVHNDPFVSAPAPAKATTPSAGVGIPPSLPPTHQDEPLGWYPGWHLQRHAYFRVAFKPPATISQDQTTARYDASGEGILAAKGRHDPNVVPRAVPIVEAMAALTIADALMAQHARQMGMKIATAGR